MNIEIKGIHYDISQTTEDFINKKLKRLDHVKDLMVDLLLTVTHEKKEFKVDATVNFRWGLSAHISVSSIDLYPGIENLIDKLDQKATKEKEKIQEHQKP
jgi:putative sigma-54 modulation protein